MRLFRDRDSNKANVLGQLVRDGFFNQVDGTEEDIDEIDAIMELGDIDRNDTIEIGSSFWDICKDAIKSEIKRKF